jgi:hypothetical protein
MNKRIAVVFAICSFILFAVSAHAEDDWTFNFDVGFDISAYNTDKTDVDGFSKPRIFVGLSAKQAISERLSLIEDVYYKAINIEKTSVSRDMKSVALELGFEYGLTPWPPPPLKWIPALFPKSFPSLPTLREQTNVYLKLTAGFLFPEDQGLDQDNFNTTFIGIGWKYNNSASKLDGSYVEIGTGSSERFDSAWRYVKSNIKFFYKMSDNKDSWKAFMSTELDIGSGDDDFRFGMGLTRDAIFVVNLLKGFAGGK